MQTEYVRKTAGKSHGAPSFLPLLKPLLELPHASAALGSRHGCARGGLPWHMRLHACCFSYFPALSAARAAANSAKYFSGCLRDGVG